MSDSSTPDGTKADIGVTGLAVMGRNLARNLARHGHKVALHNRSPERTRSLVRDHGDEGTFLPSESMADFVASLRRPRVIIVMVQAGAGTDAVINVRAQKPGRYEFFDEYNEKVARGALVVK